MVNALLLLFIAVAPALAQVPRVCVQNATQPDAICCPSIPGGPPAPCGGPQRGRCIVVKAMINDDFQEPKGPVNHDVNDNRMDWPIHIFQRVCECNPRFYGYACQHSLRNQFRRGGQRIRRDIASLTKEERLHVRDVFVKSREEMSDMVILADTMTTKNPDGSKLITYFNVSIYDFFIFLNYYTSKGLNFNPAVPTPPGQTDLVHRSINVLPWHRYFLADFERALERIHLNLTLTKNPSARNIPPFALPYWDWTGKTRCDACTDDLVGAIDESNPRGLLSSGSPFATWRVFCGNQIPGGHPCDPMAPRPLLWRAYGKDPRHKSLPTLEEAKFTMDATMYDLDPCTEMANASSFRNLLEGYIGADNNFTALKEGQRFMAMKVRQFINGTWNDLALGPNDPLFWLHQAFVDKLFADWGAKAPRGSVGLPPGFKAWPGENRTEHLVPFLPPVTIGEAERLFGPYAVQYAPGPPPPGIAKSIVSLRSKDGVFSGAFIISGIIGMIVGCAIASVLFVIVRKRRGMYKKIADSEKRPLLKRYS